MVSALKEQAPIQKRLQLSKRWGSTIGVLKSRLPAYFFFLIPLSHPFLCTNPDPALILSRLSCSCFELASRVSPQKIAKSRIRPSLLWTLKDEEVAKCCRTKKIPGNDQPPTEVHWKPGWEHYASSRSFSSKNEWHWGQAQEESFSSGWRKTWFKLQFSLITAPRKKLSYLRMSGRIN